MFKHYCSYIEAFNLILRLTKETLKKEYIKASGEESSTQEYLEKMLSCIELEEK